MQNALFLVHRLKWQETICTDGTFQTYLSENIIAVIDSLYYFEFSDPGLNKEYVYGVEVSPSEEVMLDVKERSEYKWCDFQEALQLLSWKENREALRRLNNILTEHS